MSPLDLTSKMRLLYAEDDADTRDLICLALGSQGFEVVCPKDLQDFIKVAKNELWDLYMLDNWMPGISGVELCKTIRAFDTTTPIVFYSAAGFEHDKKQALDAGAVAYMVKPIALDNLILNLRAVADSRQAS